MIYYNLFIINNYINVLIELNYYIFFTIINKKKNNVPNSHKF